MTPLRELLRSNDPVFISWVRATLSGEGIETVILDGHISLVEGSIGAFPRRIMVDDDQFARARAVVDAGPMAISAEDLDREAREAQAGLATSEDRLLDGQVVLRQPRQGFRTAIDPVLLAAALPARPGQRILDVGCGVGAAGLCLASRVPDTLVDGVDVQDDLVALARENATINGMNGRMTFYATDITSDARPPHVTYYDHVMTNPPFGDPSRHRPPDDQARALAKIETGPPLEHWLDYCLRRLNAKGCLTVIHRADALDRILVHLSGRLGALRVFPLWPKPGTPARRVIISGQKGRKTPIELMPGLVLHDPSGAYTASAQRVLREGQSLDQGGSHQP